MNYSNNKKDEVIFQKAKSLTNIIIITKDRDFGHIQSSLQSPPKVIIVKCSNCPKAE
jgi:predicted nuclease of predicted toxin-antitoxin system